jgi:hypothetical protein
MGGLLGVNTGILTDSYSTGLVTGRSGAAQLGGLIGFNSTGATVSNAYASGAVTGGPKTQNLGGLVGYNGGHLNNTYSIGAVSAGTKAKYLGGLVGQVLAGSTANSSYWNRSTSLRSTSAQGTGLSAALMMAKSSYKGWDFVSTWQPPGNGFYPRLDALPLPLTWKVANATAHHGTTPQPGAATLSGIVKGDTVTAVIGIYNAAGKRVTLSPTTPVGVYSEQVTGLGGANALDYTLSPTGNTPGTLTVQ